jgi:hypothetical protein
MWLQVQSAAEKAKGTKTPEVCVFRQSLGKLFTFWLPLGFPIARTDAGTDDQDQKLSGFDHPDVLFEGEPKCLH